MNAMTSEEESKETCLCSPIEEKATPSLKESEDMCLCPLEGIIEVVSKKWALQIIATIGNHPKLRFNEILEKLGKISPTTLSERLKELEVAGLVKREAYAEIPPRVEYSLTEDGRELRSKMKPLMEWATTRATS